MRAILAWLATLAVATLGAAAPAGAADEVFQHRGWKGYVVRDEPMGGCRMSYRLNGGLHAVVHVTADFRFLVGFVDPNARLAYGTEFFGFVRFDGDYFQLTGSADNPQLVTFGTDRPGMERAFRGSHRMRMEWANGRGWIDMSLRGSDRATDLLRQCARRYAAPPPPPVTSYAPAPPTRYRPPSFDCRYAGRATEFAVCADPLLGHLDAEMADIHGIARAMSRRRTAFDLEQNRWRAGRDACGASRACIERSYRRRIDELGVLAGLY